MILKCYRNYINYGRRNYEMCFAKLEMNFVIKYEMVMMQ